ncbi:hypothetical protein THASP1DRAFT_21564 [Thamnocephalis sphaerospora]|uniref:Uncharacterized protein n=1 Tax=Thamnocephalis sphaerospora TaxID=78915 RepID=A0A4P9XWK1_9FUNG|nr:hypothetical protein THASP1DRAFT_21564 [Thamnocephalis sphaerospora]|eukprot:RKP10743.1 hypothetical protein THASP1DRAFT_21564 [Thamnocephalis sphaerospora]
MFIRTSHSASRTSRNVSARHRRFRLLPILLSISLLAAWLLPSQLVVHAQPQQPSVSSPVDAVPSAPAPAPTSTATPAESVSTTPVTSPAASPAANPKPTGSRSTLVKSFNDKEDEHQQKKTGKVTSIGLLIALPIIAVLLGVAIFFIICAFLRRRRRLVGPKDGMRTAEAGKLYDNRGRARAAMRFPSFYDTDSTPASVRPSNSIPRRKGAMGRQAGRAARTRSLVLPPALRMLAPEESVIFDEAPSHPGDITVIETSVTVSPMQEVSLDSVLPPSDALAFPPRSQSLPEPQPAPEPTNMFSPVARSRHLASNIVTEAGDRMPQQAPPSYPDATRHLLPEDIALPADVSPVPSPGPSADMLAAAAENATEATRV